MAIESGFIPRREYEIAEQSRRIVLALLEGVSAGVGSLFERAFEEPVGTRPHQTALAFLGRLRKTFDAQAGQIEKEEAVSGSGLGRQRAPGRAVLPKYRTRITEALSSVPSPAAVLLRSVPALALSVALLQLIPVDLGLPGRPGLRLALGLVAGLIGVLLLFELQVAAVRRKLFALVQVWLDQYRQVLAEEDVVRQRRSHSAMCRAMIGALEWFLSGTGDHAPLPGPFIVHLEPDQKRKEEAGATPADLFRPQDVLGKSPDLLAAAVGTYYAVRDQLSSRYQPSRLETLLPRSPSGDPDEASRVFVGLGASRPGEDLARLSAAPMPPFSSASVDPAWPAVRPFKVLPVPGRTSEPKSRWPAWRRSFALPDGKTLLDPKEREPSSAFGFLDATRRLAEARLQGTMNLTNRMAKDLGAGPIQQSALWRAWTGLSLPSLATTVPNVPPRWSVIASDEDDQLATTLHVRNGLGRGRLNILCQVQLGLGAARILDSEVGGTPPSRLGRAWKAIGASAHEHPALAPVSLDGGGSR
jgi:hypothetical protein